jgi:hypothetical protein
MQSNKRDELTTNGIANAVLDRQRERYLIDCCLLIKRPAEADVASTSTGLTSSNQSWEGELDEANLMIVPKLVVVTKADWRMPQNTRQS